MKINQLVNRTYKYSNQILSLIHFTCDESGRSVVIIFVRVNIRSVSNCDCIVRFQNTNILMSIEFFCLCTVLFSATLCLFHHYRSMFDMLVSNFILTYTIKKIYKT